MNIPFIDLHAQYVTIKKDIDEAIQKVVTSGRFEQGEEIQLFEKEFARYLDARYCISLNSGTDALVLGLRALELQSGDEVIMPAHTFIATAIGAVENHLKPVFVDIDEDYGINLEDLLKKITNRTKAIILVHLYGKPDKIEEVRDVIKKTGKKIYLIEDACQAHGAKYRGKKVGTFGVFSAFSFYPTKNLGAYGDGGAIITNDPQLEKKYKLLKQYGQEQRYFSKTDGVNSRLDTIQAAILRVKLRHLDQWNTMRKNIAKTYASLLENNSNITTPNDTPGRESVYHVYAIRAKQRDDLLKYLKHQGITALIHYPLPLHLQETYRSLKYKRGDLPIVEKIAAEVMSLPMYPEMTNGMVQNVAEVMRRFYTSSS